MRVCLPQSRRGSFLLSPPLAEENFFLLSPRSVGEDFPFFFLPHEVGEDCGGGFRLTLNNPPLKKGFLIHLHS